MDLKPVTRILTESSRVVIMGHKRGDVDCYGSSFALAAALESLGKQVEILEGEKYPDNLDFLFYYYSGNIVSEVGHEFDTLIFIDGSDLARMSDSIKAKKYLASDLISVQIDHHTKGDLSEIVNVSLQDENVSSTAELVYEIITDLGVNIDKDIATLLLAGIIADTSSFQNQNTTERSLEIASELLKKGARKKAIITQLFGSSEVDVLKLWGLAMKRLNLNHKYSTVSTYLTHADITACGISGDAVSGIVNYLNQVKEARLVMLVTEEDPGQIKVSFRTRDLYIDVAVFANQLGGGGHVKAAGVSFQGQLSEVCGNPKIN